MLRGSVLIFDVDDTLYQCGSLRNEKEEVLINLFFRRKLGINSRQAKEIINDIRKRYYYEIDALEKDYPMKKQTFLEEACRVDMSFLKPDSELNGLLQKLPQRKIIFTDNSANHARDCLKALAINENIFPDIFDGHAMNYTFKHRPESFELLIKKFNLDAKKCILFEDNPDNLKMAQNFGMKTVLITPENSKNPNDFDYTYPNINIALKQMFQTNK